jgi:two-component system, LytTR family, response regulator
MKLRCYIIDDEITAREGLKEYIDDTQFLELCGESGDALEAVVPLKELKPDILFLDIHMHSISGIDFLEIYKPEMAVILTTAHPDYAITGYELNVSNYLLKPISYQRFLKAVSKVFDSLETAKEDSSPDFIFVRADRKIKKIFITDILYIQSLQNYVTFHLREGTVVSLITLKSLEEQLAKYDFIKIQKKYVINPYWITALEGNDIVIQNQRLPISRDLKSEVYRKILIGKYIK